MKELSIIVMFGLLVIIALRGLMDSFLEAIFPSGVDSKGFKIPPTSRVVSITINPYAKGWSGVRTPPSGEGPLPRTSRTLTSSEEEVEVCYVYIFDPTREEVFSLEEQVRVWRALDRSLTKRGRQAGEKSVRDRYKHYRKLLKEVREGQETP